MIIIWSAFAFEAKYDTPATNALNSVLIYRIPVLRWHKTEIVNNWLDSNFFFIKSLAIKAF